MPRESIEARLARMNAMYSAGAAAQLAVETKFAFTKEHVKDSVGCVLEGVPSTLGLEKGWCVRVKAVRPGGHAERVGIGVGMAILTINDVPIKTPGQGVSILNAAVGEVTITAAPPTAQDNELFAKKQNPEASRKEKLLAEQHRAREKERLQREAEENERLALRAAEIAHAAEEKRLREEEEAAKNPPPPDVSDEQVAKSAADITAEINAQAEEPARPLERSRRPKETVPMWRVVTRAADESAESPSSGRQMWRGEPHVRVVLDGGKQVYVRLAALTEMAPELVAALPEPVDAAAAAATEGDEAANEAEQTGAAPALASPTAPAAPAAPAWDTRDLTFPRIDPNCVRLLFEWMEAAYDVRAADAALDAATEAVHARRKPLAELSATELAHLFQYHAFKKGAQLLTYTPDLADEQAEDQAPFKGPVLTASALDTPASKGSNTDAYDTRYAREYDEESSGAIDGPAAPDHSKAQPVYRSGERVELTGAMLDADASADGFDEKAFCAAFSAYRTETLLRHVPMWQSRGVPMQEILPRAEREKEEVVSEELLAATVDARARAASVAAMAVASEGLCIMTLMLGHNLQLTDLVGKAVDTLAEHFTVEGAALELTRARSTGVNRYIDRVSGFCVANIHLVTKTARWNELVPLREKTRMLALAATARTNPLGLSSNAVGAASLAEVVAYAKETLREMQERLDTAKVDTKADELTGAASAEHAWKMIANQDDRLRVLTAFIASQEAALANS